MSIGLKLLLPNKLPMAKLSAPNDTMETKLVIASGNEVTSPSKTIPIHGYVLAEMAVHQTRYFFLRRDGHLIDNPRIGPELCASY